MEKNMKRKIDRKMITFLMVMALILTASCGDVNVQAAAKKATKKEAAKTTETSSFYKNKQKIYLDSSWKYADHAKITSGYAVMYTAKKNRKDIVIAVNAGHGTKGGSSVKTLCHPDGSPKLTGGTTQAGAIQAVAVSDGMTFRDGTAERDVTLRMAKILKKKLLAEGYDVLMVRDGSSKEISCTLFVSESKVETPRATISFRSVLSCRINGSARFWQRAAISGCRVITQILEKGTEAAMAQAQEKSVRPL